MDAQDWIRLLEMEAHPEGGFYKPSFRSEETAAFHSGEKALYTSIYFLLESGEVSHLHRLKSDELWYYHAGSPLTVHIIGADGAHREEKLGLDVQAGEKPQVRVEKGSIFGSSVDRPDTLALVGCMVAPGFEFEDFELFTQAELAEAYPQHERVIKRLAYKELK